MTPERRCLVRAQEVHPVQDRGPGRKAFEWGLGIVGGIAAFLGLFILFGGDDQSVGLGGNLSWTVGEINVLWGFGLLVTGAALVVLVGFLVLGDRRMEHRASAARSSLRDLQWHAGVFVLVNAFLWIQDLAAGGGLDYAYWTTIPWGFGLAMHALAYALSDKPKPPREVVEEAAKELQHQ
jgi:hypothetical protein